ncbi:nuclear transport factor 2 family protein [Rhodovarius crocodyli]|nr:nuclear transport factor 2 family protein [Rhodovarius crocodyli]
MRIEADIPFAEVAVAAGTRTLMMDAYLPEGPGPHPALVLAFGGAYHRGSRKDDVFAGARGSNTAMAEYARRFAARGYACFSIDYRLAADDAPAGPTPVLTVPGEIGVQRMDVVRQMLGMPPASHADHMRIIEGAIDDMAAAGRFVARQAARFGIDPDRIVLGGWSAGARAALYAALAEGVPCAGVIALSARMESGDLAAHLPRLACPPPVLLITAQDDLGTLPAETPGMAAALRHHGGEALHVTIPGWDHWYPAEAVTDAGTSVEATMAEALERWTRSGEALLEDFAAAYNRHDIEALLGMVTEDCVFETAFGTRHQGKAELREALPGAWRQWPDARWDGAQHVVNGDRGFSEWVLRGTDAAGTRTELRGVDLFRLRHGLIARKDTFRKPYAVP